MRPLWMEFAQERATHEADRRAPLPLQPQFGSRRRCFTPSPVDMTVATADLTAHPLPSTGSSWWGMRCW